MPGNAQKPGAQRLSWTQSGLTFDSPTKGFLGGIFDIGMMDTLAHHLGNHRSHQRSESA